jgi:hypothetical protein
MRSGGDMRVGFLFSTVRELRRGGLWKYRERGERTGKELKNRTDVGRNDMELVERTSIGV